MLSNRPDPGPSVFLLADHLDAALAAGEDLLGLRNALAPALTCKDARTTEGGAAAVRLFVDRARLLELRLAMRTLEARKGATRVLRADTSLRLLADLFVGGTAPLADAVEELGDRTWSDFLTGQDAVAYLRSRGVVPRDAAGVLDLDQLCVSSRFLVARRIELGSLLDLTATFLDALDLTYSVYQSDTAVHETCDCTAPAVDHPRHS
jgi:hypothetical protein